MKILAIRPLSQASYEVDFLVDEHLYSMTFSRSDELVWTAPMEFERVLGDTRLPRELAAVLARVAGGQPFRLPIEYCTP